MSYIMANDEDFYTQHDSTARKLFDSSGNITANKIYGGTTSLLIATSGGYLYQHNQAITAESSEINASTFGMSIQTITSAVSSSTNIVGYGITIYQGDTGCSLQMDAPVQAGIIKTIVFTAGSSIARSIASTNTTGSSNNDRGWSFFVKGTSNSTGVSFTTGSTIGFSMQFYAMSTKQWLPMGNLSDSSTINYTFAGST